MLQSVFLLMLLLIATLSERATAQENLVKVQRTASFGGPGGEDYELWCPIGTFMTGLRARHGAWIDALAPICSRYVHFSWITMTKFEEIEPQPFTGGSGGGEAFIRCEGYWGVIVSVELVRADNEWGSVGHIAVNCGNYHSPSSAVDKAPGSADFFGRPTSHKPSVLKCNAPFIAAGIFGRSGAAIDRVGLTCLHHQRR